MRGGRTLGERREKKRWERDRAALRKALRGSREGALEKSTYKTFVYND